MPAALAPQLVLAAASARDLMTSNPVSLRAEATVEEALALFTERGLSAAPVIDDAGHALGVLSRADLLVHEHERTQAAVADTTLVRDLMTPAVFSVTPTTPAARVVEEMLALKVHQLFVVERSGEVVGVISAFDVLRALQP